MLDILDIDLPQLPVKVFQGTSVLKDMPVLLNPEMYLWGYPRRKFHEFSVRHAMLNEQLQNIYIAHAKQKQTRQAEEYYDIDSQHYQELLTVTSVVNALKQLTDELIAVFYFAHYIKTHNAYPVENRPAAQLAELKTVNNISAAMQLYERLSIELARVTSQEFFVFDASVQIILEDEPMIHILKRKDWIFADVQKEPLRPLVDLYRQSFELSKEILDNIGPRGFTIY